MILSNKKLQMIFFPIISGVLLSLSFSIEKLWVICFVALIPLFYAIFKFAINKKRTFLIMLLFSLAYYIPLMQWVYQVHCKLPFSKNVSYLILFICTILIGVVQSKYYIVSTFFYSHLRRNKFYDVITFSVLFVFGEYLMERTPWIAFPWGKISAIPTSFVPFIQSASLFGDKFISLIVLLVNGFLAYGIFKLKNKKSFIKYASVALLIFVINISYGLIKLKMPRNPKNPYGVMVVQGNYSGLNKWESSLTEMFKTYIDLTYNNIDDNTKIVIWPETAVPTMLIKESYYEKELLKLAKEKDVTIIAGFFTESSEDKAFNSLVAFYPDGKMSEPYKKAVLAPFGEYFPLGDIVKKFIPPLRELVETMSIVSVGKENKSISAREGEVGCIICYESIFRKSAFKNIENGSEILAIASNDSWFGETSALRQHFSHAILRAVESNRFVIRSSNTGVSAIISPNGEIMCKADFFEQTTCKHMVYNINQNTLIFNVDILYIVSLLVFIGTVISFLIRKLLPKNR